MTSGISTYVLTAVLALVIAAAIQFYLSERWADPSAAQVVGAVLVPFPVFAFGVYGSLVSNGPENYGVMWVIFSIPIFIASLLTSMIVAQLWKRFRG